ncbi:MAG: ParB/RepB/Spo0J family partition protein [Butyrivibrio sp.]|nr:ParB/RepB/Spo0J family partition protein [Butyrivibrio sp.]
MANRVGKKIKLASIDELLGAPSTEGTVDIDVRAIYPFENHPFKVLDDDRMEDLVESIRENGVITPVLVRPDDEGTYEMISGHRRLHAAKRVGLQKIPAIVKEMTNDDAVVAMVDSNMQREEILPSERAYSLKMKMDAMNHRGSRTDLSLSPEETKIHSAEAVGETVGLKRAQVHRYIRLTFLIPRLLEQVDEGLISIGMAVELSYLSKTYQEWIADYMFEKGMVTMEQVMELRNYRDDSTLTKDQLFEIIASSKAVHEKKKTRVILNDKELSRYFPPEYTNAMIAKVINGLLEQWKRERDSKENAE